MKDVRIDAAGEFRCWKCGGKHFENKRTFRAKAIGVTAGVATLGVAGAVAPLVTHKKLKCQACGEYNQTGNAQPFKGPANALPPKPGSWAATKLEVDRKAREKAAAKAAEKAVRNLQVLCHKCQTGITIPDTDRSTCPNCGAIGRRLVCTNCQGVLRIWGDKSKSWVFACPKCETKQTHRIS